MTRIDRRRLLSTAAAALALPPTVARAAAIDADVRTGTLADVEHVVIFMQENRAFDHYFGAMNGVRGFADPFPIPVPDAPALVGKTVWSQVNAGAWGGPASIAPFPLNTTQTSSHMRVEGTPHNWFDAQAAWDEGRMHRWPEAKTPHAMGYYRREDIPFQYALADAFTLCDAYHCAAQSGTNTNRLFLWSGTNDPTGRFGGPAITNSHDSLPAYGGAAEPYRWTTYVERLQAAGVTWRIYQDMADNFTDNPVVGFKTFRDSLAGAPGSDPELAARGLTTHKLDALRADVLAGKLPQVSYIVAPAAACEHPGPSSPAQGADYTARVLDALTADPKVWARTVLLLMYDENDGFFDHAPPPAPPSRDPAAPGAWLGASTVETAGEYHLVRNPTEASADRDALMGRPYGLGPRVPMLVISPWSRGGWVNSQVFDHTSIIRFLEKRFDVAESNISPWRRAVCGDLTTAFDFKTPNTAPFLAALPATAAAAARAAALPGRTRPPTPAALAAPAQTAGPRPSRALPYELGVAEAAEGGRMHLTIRNEGAAGAVFHVYDRLRLDRPPRRYTVEPGKALTDGWDAGAYDLWVLGPNGFHRHYVGKDPVADVRLTANTTGQWLRVTLANPSTAGRRLSVSPNAYHQVLAPWRAALPAGGELSRTWRLRGSGGWYDLSVRSDGTDRFLRRLAGRLESGAHAISDPAMAGLAKMDQPNRA